jgi:hypothetical protein
VETSSSIWLVAPTLKWLMQTTRLIMQNQHVPLFLCVRPVSKHSNKSTKKKWLLKRRFRMCDMEVHAVEMARISQIAPPPQINKTTSLRRHQRMLAELRL